MHTTPSPRAASCLITSLLLAGCGANVVFDTGGGGSTGTNPSGGSTADGGAPGAGGFDGSGGFLGSGGSSSTSFGCDVQGCSVGQVTCACDGTCFSCNDFECFEVKASVVCEWGVDSARCRCEAFGETVGQCEQLDLDCDLVTSCCGKVFEAAF